MEETCYGDLLTGEFSRSIQTRLMTSNNTTPFRNISLMIVAHNFVSRTTIALSE